MFEFFSQVRQSDKAASGSEEGVGVASYPGSFPRLGWGGGNVTCLVETIFVLVKVLTRSQSPHMS